jgi:hypothetical protein
VNNTLASELTGQANFIRRFVTNYDEITKGFMHLLKKGVPFCWDEATQCSFQALKHALASSPLLRPPDYNKDLLLYLVAAEMTIDMVFVQEYDFLEDHVIYYLSRGLVGPERKYSHVKKIYLATIHAVQWFCHYIFLRKTIVIVVMNPFQYVLT